MHDGEVQVLPPETGDDDSGVAQLEGAQDVLAHGVRGRSGEGNGLGVAQLRAGAAQAQVVRAEVMPPLAQAVRLINGQQGDGHAAQQAHEALLRKAFRSNINNLQTSGAQIPHHLSVFVRAQGGVDRGSGDVALLQGIHLVLHQRDEGRNDNREAGAAQGRELVAEGFAAARGHDG